MKESISSNSKFKEVALLGAVVILALALAYCSYVYTISTPIKAIFWITWFVVSLVLAYFTKVGRAVYEFANESKAELLKVVWPTRQETTQTTLIVMTMVTLTGFVLWAIDSLFIWVIAKLTHLG